MEVIPRISFVKELNCIIICKMALSRKIYEAYLKSEQVDVNLNVNDGSILTHSLVLFTRTDYFKTYASPRWTTRKDEHDIKYTLQIPVQHQDMLNVLEFFYCDEIDLSNDNIASVVYIADFLRVDDLLHKTDTFLLDTMNHKNAVTVFFNLS